MPPRKELRKHTRFPVYVPSAAPAYNASYDASYLETRSDASFPTSIAALMERVEDPAVRGYCTIMMDYLRDACGARGGEGWEARWGAAGGRDARWAELDAGLPSSGGRHGSS